MIAFHGIDATELEQQPVYNNNPAVVVYFVGVVIAGAYFVLNMLVGVLIDTYMQKREAYGRSILMTPQQDLWVEVQKLMAGAQVKTRYLRPVSSSRWGAFRAHVFDIVRSPLFDQIVVTMIVLNMIMLATLHARMTEDWVMAFTFSDVVFTSYFTVELVMRLIAFGRVNYFRDAWGRLDFIIVAFSWAGLAVDLTSDDPSNMVVNVLRVVRVMRSFKLIPKLHGMRVLISTLIYSLPALANVAGTMLLFLFIYAILGMNLLGNIKLQPDAEYNQYANFRNFGNAMLLLFRVLTGDVWNELMQVWQRFGLF